jgi:hypothetical protein
MTYEYYEAPMSYDEIVATQGEIIKDWVIASWQGDYVYLLKNNEKFGFIVIGYGSCSGCDALQGCENDEEFNQLKKEIVDRIFWGTAGDIEAYIINDNANRWYYHEEDWIGIKKEIMEILG